MKRNTNSSLKKNAGSFQLMERTKNSSRKQMAGVSSSWTELRTRPGKNATRFLTIREVNCEEAYALCGGTARSDASGGAAKRCFEHTSRTPSRVAAVNISIFGPLARKRSTFSLGSKPSEFVQARAHKKTQRPWQVPSFRGLLHSTPAHGKNLELAPEKNAGTSITLRMSKSVSA